ncbi:MAG TPA: M48 family metallopeptidase [bacterium]|nr:M48 family metallopeptidase [bacterium]HPG44079.1 M48 family metallopeptidase [bacterium]HPM96445.1 M48 family metallopeptidase [bacterium]
MNIYAWIVLLTLLFEAVLNFIADQLNLRALKPQLPAEFQGVYDEIAYARSQDYTRVKTRFGLVVSTLELLFLLAFWFAGGFGWLDQQVRAFALHPIITGLIYIGVLMFAHGVLSLPFAIYSTFVIEERFGFNRTTIKTFILDLIKGTALSIAVGAPLLAGVLAIFQYGGTWAWLYCWIGVTIFTLLIQFVAPVWIMPLFNKFTPLADGELLQRIRSYSESVHFPLQGVFVMDGSKRSGKSNAFFTGFGRHKRIALYDTLIEKHTVGELVSVLAHEIGHYKKKHIIKNLIAGILHMGVLFFLLSIFLRHSGLFAAFYVEEVSIYAGLIFFGLLYTPIELVLSVILSVFSRRHEFEADRFVVETTDEGESFIAALKKLSLHNLSNLSPHPFTVFLNYSHPPVLQRIHAVRRLIGERAA